MIMQGGRVSFHFCTVHESRICVYTLIADQFFQYTNITRKDKYIPQLIPS